MKINEKLSRQLEGSLFGVYLFIFIPIFCAVYLISGQANTSLSLIGLAVLVWYLQMVGVLVGFHRYFAHRSFETGTVMRMILGLLGCISGQKGPIFWASHHRHHHKHCEDEQDIHSPYEFGELKGWTAIKGFLWSHFMHIAVEGPFPIEEKYVRDWLKKPEIVWMERLSTPIYYAFGAAMALIGGVDWLIWGFFIPSFASWNCVMLVNSAVHIWGNRPFRSQLAPNCNARNIWWLSIPMLGDNWHNNHHADMNSCRAGFHWWQVDLNWYLIWALSKVGLIWNLQMPDWKKLNNNRLDEVAEEKLNPSSKKEKREVINV